MKILPRYIEPELRSRLKSVPIVAITGPRQAGKTTLAKNILPLAEKEVLYLDLELPSDLNRLRNAELFLKENEEKLVIIDEVQRRPELFPLLRSLVDQHREPGRFLILGSASPEMLRQSSETLAGRISYLELTPFHYRELPEINYKRHWLRGGFPPAILAGSDELAFQWLQDFSITFIERDLPQFGLNAPSHVLRNLLLMLSGIHGNLLNQSSLGNSLGVTMPTIKRYLSYLENAYFIRFLQPWYTNVSKRLVKTPKLYYRDSGVFHSFAGIENINQLFGYHAIGASWEGYVIQQLIANLPARVIPFFYRTKDGAEIDLLLVKGNKPVIALECKFNERIALSKGNRIAFSDVDADVNLILTPSGGDYPFDENIRVTDLENVWNYIDEL